MKNVVIIAGKAASGKDTLKRNLMNIFWEDNKNINDIITCTTRPMREYEVDGQDYNFYTNEEMTHKLINGELAEAVVFNGWVYGTEYTSLSDNKLNIGVFNLAGTEALKQDSELNTFIIYLDVPADMRLIRYLKRDNMNDEKIREMFRRYSADEEDFMDVEDIADLIYEPNPEGSPMDLAYDIYEIICEKFDI